MLPDIAAAGLLPKMLLLVGLSACPAPPAPDVSFKLTLQEPRVTHSLSHEQLGVFKVATQISHAPDEVFITGGITESNMNWRYAVKYGGVVSPLDNKQCLWVKSVAVDFTYAPIVHIALNYPQGSCRFNTTWQHELRHVNTDKITLTEYEGVMRRTMELTTQQLGALGPFDPSDAKNQQKKIEDYFTQAIKNAFAAMDQVRMQRQRTVDTREEYMYLSNKCAHEKR